MRGEGKKKQTIAAAGKGDYGQQDGRRPGEAEASGDKGENYECSINEKKKGGGGRNAFQGNVGSCRS